MQPSDETESRLLCVLREFLPPLLLAQRKSPHFVARSFLSLVAKVETIYSLQPIFVALQDSLILQAYDKNYSYAYAHFSLLLYREQPTRVE